MPGHSFTENMRLEFKIKPSKTNLTLDPFKFGSFF